MERTRSRPIVPPPGLNTTPPPPVEPPQERAETPRQPRENVYVCQTCGACVLTVDVADGVTPFIIGCKRERCKGMAHSSFYPRGPKPPHMPKEASFEWYKPDAEEIAKLDPVEDAGIIEHVKQGGLLLRERTDAPPVYHEEGEASEMTKADFAAVEKFMKERPFRPAMVDGDGKRHPIIIGPDFAGEMPPIANRRVLTMGQGMGKSLTMPVLLTGFGGLASALAERPSIAELSKSVRDAAKLPTKEKEPSDFEKREAARLAARTPEQIKAESARFDAAEAKRHAKAAKKAANDAKAREKNPCAK